jgi:hypothetical protein
MIAKILSTTISTSPLTFRIDLTTSQNVIVRIGVFRIDFAEDRQSVKSVTRDSQIPIQFFRRRWVSLLRLDRL